jgi:hypothetical protein
MSLCQRHISGATPIDPGGLAAVASNMFAVDQYQMERYHSAPMQIEKCMIRMPCCEHVDHESSLITPAASISN